MDFLQLLLENDDAYRSFVLFPNNSAKKYWVNHIAKKRGCVALNRFIIFQELQQLLLEDLIIEQNPSKKILTAQEQIEMISLLLTRKEVQSLIFRMEQLPKSNIEHSRKEKKLPHHYSNKLRSLFIHYVEYARSNDASYKVSPYLMKPLSSLLALYVDFLEAYHCEDTISLTYRMLQLQEKKSPLEQAPLERAPPEHSNPKEKKKICLQVVYPHLLSSRDRMWMHAYGSLMNEGMQVSDDTLFLFKEHEINDTSESTQQYYYSHLDTLPPFPSLLHKNIEDHANLHVFPTIDQELEAIFSAISELLHEGVIPHDIAISVCNGNELIQSEIADLAYKYQVPYEAVSDYTNVQLFLSLLDQVYSNYCHPHTLAKFFGDPSFAWKEQSHNHQLVQIGLEHCCIGDTSYSRWNYVLKNMRDQKNELIQYFDRFVTSVTSVIKAKSYKILYEQLTHFFTVFWAKEKSSEKNSTDTHSTDTHSTGTHSKVALRILHMLEELVVFEQYIEGISQRGGDGEDNNKSSIYRMRDEVMSPWDALIFHSTSKNKRKVSGQRSCVHYYDFPLALTTRYPYHFICNMSQLALANTTSRVKSFNDFLDMQYAVSQNEEYYETYKKALFDRISSLSSSVYMSASYKNFDGVNMLPVDWNIHEVTFDEHYDIWKQEQLFWSAPQGSTCSFAVSKHQREGLRYQQVLGWDKRQRSISKNGISEKVSALLFDQRQTRIGPSSMQDFLDTEYFLFEHILKTHPYLSDWDYSMAELRSWGILYHKILEQLVSVSGAQGDTPLPEVLSEMLEGAIAQSGAHPYTWDMIQEVVRTFRWDEHIKNIVTMRNSINNKTESAVSETRYEISLFDICSLIGMSNLPSYLHAITISGRVDLILEADKDTKFILDYKRKFDDVSIKNNRYLFQLWFYYLMVNKIPIKEQKISLSFQQPEQLLGNIYNVSANPEESLLLYDTRVATEEPTLTFLNKTLNLLAEVEHFPPILQRGVEELHHMLHEHSQEANKKTSDKTSDETNDETNDKTSYAIANTTRLLQPEIPLHIRLITRKGCYVYTR